MQRYIFAAAIVSVVAVACAFAQEDSPAPHSGPPAQLTLPPGFDEPDDLPPPEDEPPPIQCDLKASPDYVPGVDAKGRAVAPADVSTGQQVVIDTNVYVETRSRDPRLRGTGVVVNLPDLGAPGCVPLQVKLP